MTSQSRLICSQPTSTNAPSYPFISRDEIPPVGISSPIAEQASPEISSPGNFTSAISRYNSTIQERITQWKRDFARIPNFFRHGRQGTPGATEIQYSVFRPPPDITPLRNIPTDGFSNTGPVTKADFDSIVAEAVVGIALNSEKSNPRLISLGSSGSYFIHDVHGKTIGIFKPQDEEPYGPLSPKMTKWIHRNFFPCFFGRSCLIPNTGYIAESAASLLDRQLQLFIVPYTDTVTLASPSFYYPPYEQFQNFIMGHSNHCRSKVGSFQLFLQGFLGADKFFTKYPLPGQGNISSRRVILGSKVGLGPRISGHDLWNKGSLLRELRLQVEKLVILDFITRNTDRGFDNWMLQLDEADPENPHIKLRAIDNGLSFPWKHPDEWRSFPYGWLYLPLNLIGQPFSDETRSHFLPLLTSIKWWEDTTNLLREMFGRDSSFKEQMFRKQLQVLKGQAWNVVETLKNSSEGPLDMVRKARVLVLSQEVQVPIVTPILPILNAMDTPICQHHNHSILPRSNDNCDPSQPSQDFRKPLLLSNSNSITDSAGSFDLSQNLQKNWYNFVNGEIDESRYEQSNTHIISQGIPQNRFYGSTISAPERQCISMTEEDFQRKGSAPIPRTTKHLSLVLPGSKTVTIEKLQVVQGSPMFACC